MSDLMFWTDVETFGLHSAIDPIIEISAVVTNSQLEMIDTFSSTIWTNDHDRRLDLMVDTITQAADGKIPVTRAVESERFVYAMHTDTGLFSQARDELRSLGQVEDELLTFVQKYNFDRTDPICGSSVGFDRGFLEQYMPVVIGIFSYRNIDVSSFKEMFKKKFPNRWKNLYETLDGSNSGLIQHRSLDDCFMTINEMKLYSKHFFPGADE